MGTKETKGRKFSEDIQRFQGALSNLVKESGLDSDFFCFIWFESPYVHFEAG